MKKEEPSQPTSVKDLTPAVCENSSVSIFLDTVEYNQGFRAARLLSESKGMVPKEYEGNPGNCMIALNMAKSLGLTIQAFFNWTYPVNGRLGLEAKAIVTIANQSGMFKRGIEFEEIGTIKDGDEWGFRAFAEDARYGTIIEETFTIGDAKAAGWIGNTWWKKLPKMMLKYRAASFLIKLNRPELLGGMNVMEEMRDEFATAPPRNITAEVEAAKKPVSFNGMTGEEAETPAPKKSTSKKEKETPPKSKTIPEACAELDAYMRNESYMEIVDAVLDAQGADGEIVADAINKRNEKACEKILKAIKAKLDNKPAMP